MTTPSTPSPTISPELSAVASYDRPVKLHVTCLHIRHKLMFCDERHAQRGRVDDSSGTRAFWCARTQESLGPDNQPVSPSECSMGRSCYCHGE